MITLPSSIKASVPETYKHEIVLNAPVSGELVALSELNDPFLAAGLAGKGIAIRTRSLECLSPVSGTVSALDIGEQKWALKSRQGLKLSIQIGPVVTPLYGERLKIMKREASAIAKKEVLTYFDPLFLTRQWGHCYCIVTVLNKKGIQAIVSEPVGTKVVPETPLLRIYV